MNSATIGILSFQGKTRYLSCNSEGKARTVSDCPFGTSSFGDTRGLSDFVKKHSYPYANIEETIGKIHNNQTYRIYIADPTEIIDNIIKQNHDYIVYDVEPAFPEAKSYLNTEQENIKKGFKIISEYYKRLENDGLNRGDAKTVNISHLKQKIINNCSEILDESADLRAKKIEIERKLKSRQMRIKEIEENIPEYKVELERKRNKLKQNEISLQNKEQILNKWKSKQMNSHAKTKITPEELTRINYHVENNTTIINNTKSRIEKYKDRIIYIEGYLEKAPQKIETYKNEIKKLKKLLANINHALLPHIKKIQDFYTINGIKIIKRV